MDTPSSISRLRRSQTMTMAANNTILPITSRKNEELEKEVIKSRSALTDITNDSPIVGLAIGNLNTPSSTFCKKRFTTPGSGEALLRGQVKTLLQKVEEEAVISKISFEPKSFVNFPLNILAPTPANTPQLSENGRNGPESLTVSPVAAESFDFSKILVQEEEHEECFEKHVITKLLFSEFPEKLEGYESSLDNEDDDESIWSVQVNASIKDENEYEDFEVNYEDGDVNELCEVMGMICENGEIEGDDELC
ncbi:uncharacterized protein [Rutidosis leptorrhynchoides]|uniref:uncharacterized protein n=1 Tax=Rutidosis leptorrhynchoides TaxID=125765 RepID=UPI003A99D88D